MFLTFLLGCSGGPGLGLLDADWFLSVLQLHRQGDDGNLWKLLSPLGPILLNQHLCEPVRGQRD